MPKVKLVLLEDSDRDRFILDNQEAFNYGGYSAVYYYWKESLR